MVIVGYTVVSACCVGRETSLVVLWKLIMVLS